MPSEKNILQILPNIYIYIYIYLLLKKCNMEMTSYARQDQT
jgi:hypothetical protein